MLGVVWVVGLGGVGWVCRGINFWGLTFGVGGVYVYFWVFAVGGGGGWGGWVGLGGFFQDKVFVLWCLPSPTSFTASVGSFLLEFLFFHPYISVPFPY